MDYPLYALFILWSLLFLYNVIMIILVSSEGGHNFLQFSYYMFADSASNPTRIALKVDLCIQYFSLVEASSANTIRWTCFSINLVGRDVTPSVLWPCLGPVKKLSFPLTLERHCCRRVRYSLIKIIIISYLDLRLSGS